MSRTTPLRRILLACCAAAFGLPAPAAFALELIKDGRSEARVYAKVGAPDLVQDAATQLGAILSKMSGAEIPVARVAGSAEIDPAMPAIVLDALAADLGLKMEKASRARDGFRYKVDGKRLLLVGESPRGVYHGVFDLLESLGCGWYTPGAVGEVIPSRPTVALPDGLDHCEVSDSINRRFWYGGKNGVEGTGEWALRNKGLLVTGSWRHAWGGLVPAKDYFEKHPEYFSLNRGQRSPKQLCTTHPDTIRIAAESLIAQMAKDDAIVFPAGPNDGGNLCECENCAKLDTPGYLEPSSHRPACSTRVFQFARDVAEITAKKFPDRDLGVLIYSEYSRIPARLDRLHPNVFPMFAPIRRCRLHGPGNPLCPPNLLWQQEIEGWARLTKKMGFYIYNYNLADSLVPLGKIDFYRRLVAEVHKLHIEQLAWVFETIDSWAMHAPSLYLSARLSWDSRLDIDAEMDRFFTGFYAEAAEPMRRYWLRIDNAYATTPAHTGSQYGLHHVWTDALLADSRRDVEEAKRLAKSDRVKEAVAMADAGLRCAELFIQVHKATVAFDFLAADKAQAELKAHVAVMAAKPEPHWAHERYAWGYYARFTGRTVDGGAKVLRDGGQILVRFPDVWKFRKDEKAAGVNEGWFRPDHPDADWQPFATVTKSWDDQGLGWYHGDAWYRVTFTMPPDEKARAEARTTNGDLRLWFGGFDYNVDVYLNGHPLGEKKGFATPAEFDAIAQHLNFGGANTLAVRVSAGDLAELGTGGLMKPVMIYRAGAAKPPEKKGAKGQGYDM